MKRFDTEHFARFSGTVTSSVAVRTKVLRDTMSVMDLSPTHAGTHAHARAHTHTLTHTHTHTHTHAHTHL